MKKTTKDKGTKKPRPKVPIIIPNAEVLTEEELAKAKHAEKQRRNMVRRNGNEPGEYKKGKQELRIIEDDEMVAMSKQARNSVIQLLNNKMQQLNEDPEALAKVNFATLATTFGILVDKSLILEGMPTQNIAIHAKVDVNMKSDELMAELDKMRQNYTEDNK